jgi:hypothetical protein
VLRFFHFLSNFVSAASSIRISEAVYGRIPAALCFCDRRDGRATRRDAYARAMETCLATKAWAAEAAGR